MGVQNFSKECGIRDSNFLIRDLETSAQLSMLHSHHPPRIDSIPRNPPLAAAGVDALAAARDPKKAEGAGLYALAAPRDTTPTTAAKNLTETILNRGCGMGLTIKATLTDVVEAGNFGM